MLNDQWINGLVRKVKESKTEPWLHNMRRYTQVYSTSILDGCMTVCNEPRSSTRMWSDCYICYLFLMITRTMCLLMRLSTRQLNENELETNSIQNEKRIDKWGTTKKSLTCCRQLRGRVRFLAHAAASLWRTLLVNVPGLFSVCCGI